MSFENAASQAWQRTTRPGIGFGDEDTKIYLTQSRTFMEGSIDRRLCEVQITHGGLCLSWHQDQCVSDLDKTV